MPRRKTETTTFDPSPFTATEADCFVFGCDMEPARPANSDGASDDDALSDVDALIALLGRHGAEFVRNSPSAVRRAASKSQASVTFEPVTATRGVVRLFP